VEILESTFAPEYGVEKSNLILRFTPPPGTLQGRFILRASRTVPPPGEITGGHE
jgi:hypothetical protein